MKFAEPIIIESSLSHNNGRTGMGKFYVAKINGLDPKYKYDRMFLNRDYNATHNSKTSWYSYWCEIKKEGFYEIAESNNYKNKLDYLHIHSDGSYEYISRREMRKRLLDTLSKDSQNESFHPYKR